jgi:hypothetical protein
VAAAAKSTVVNPQQGDAPGPRIDIHIRPEGIAISQQRPAIAAALAGRPVAEALQLVPTLLPICGQAQLVAAQRAVAAALGRAVSPQQQAEQAGRLWREQALAAAWRCAVDWPDLLDEPRQLATLRDIRSATSDRALGAGLGDLVPGLDQVTCIEDLFDWIEQGNSMACRLARRAMAIVAGAGPGLSLVSPEALAAAAARAFAREPFDPLDPEGGPCEVGPLAMARDALVPELPAATGQPVLARVLAQILDMRAICRALRDATPADSDGDSRSDQPGTGTGSALTARGPVWHQVRLHPAETDRVADWRVLAPTDWHFGPRGPVRRDLAGLAEPAAMRLLIASYDPCAPWTLRPGSEPEARAGA